MLGLGTARLIFFSLVSGTAGGVTAAGILNICLVAIMLCWEIYEEKVISNSGTRKRDMYYEVASSWEFFEFNKIGKKNCGQGGEKAPLILSSYPLQTAYGRGVPSFTMVT